MKRLAKSQIPVVLVVACSLALGVCAVAGADTVDVHSIQATVSAASAVSGMSAISDGKALFLTRNSKQTAETFVDSARVKTEFGKRISELAFAQDGKRLAVGHKKKVSILDTGSGAVLKQFGFPRDVFWVDWLANDSDLVAVCGKVAVNIASRDAMSDLTGDSFSIVLARADGSKPLKLYSRQDYHPNLVAARMTPDRGHMTFMTREGMEHAVKMIVSFDSLSVSRFVPPPDE